MTVASENLSPAALVRAARLSTGMTQEEFAAAVNSKQSLISKYERGTVDPPAGLTIHCMTLLRPRESLAITEDSLVQLIRERLSGDAHAAMRAAIASLVSGVR
jgi:transcriptional regulator with XRE-family HTH domain